MHDSSKDDKGRLLCARTSNQMVKYFVSVINKDTFISHPHKKRDTSKNCKIVQQKHARKKIVCLKLIYYDSIKHKLIYKVNHKLFVLSSLKVMQTFLQRYVIFLVIFL